MINWLLKKMNVDTEAILAEIERQGNAWAGK